MNNEILIQFGLVFVILVLLAYKVLDFTLNFFNLKFDKTMQSFEELKADLETIQAGNTKIAADVERLHARIDSLPTGSVPQDIVDLVASLKAQVTAIDERTPEDTPATPTETQTPTPAPDDLFEPVPDEQFNPIVDEPDQDFDTGEEDEAEGSIDRR